MEWWSEEMEKGHIHLLNYYSTEKAFKKVDISPSCLFFRGLFVSRFVFFFLHLRVFFLLFGNVIEEKWADCLIKNANMISGLCSYYVCMKVPIHFHSACCCHNLLLFWFSLFLFFGLKPKKKFFKTNTSTFFLLQFWAIRLNAVFFFGSDRCHCDKSFGKMMTIIRKQKWESEIVNLM